MENRGMYDIKRTIISHIKYLSAMLLYLIVTRIFDIGCPIRRAIRMPCPACGTTRAWYHVLRFEFTGAFTYHPLFLFMPLYVLFLIHYDKMFLKYKKIKMFIAIAGGCVIFGVYVYRIITGFGDV